jgi:hypothetical protein
VKTILANGVGRLLHKQFESLTDDARVLIGMDESEKRLRRMLTDAQQWRLFTPETRRTGWPTRDSRLAPTSARTAATCPR